MMIHLIGDRSDPVDEIDRAGEVAALELSDDRVALEIPSLELAYPVIDLVSLQKCHLWSPMRIASLVPSSTELLFALGLGDSVVAVTHECDYPREAADRTHLTRSVIPEGLSASEIDRAVRERATAGQALYELDEPTLERLDVDLIVTQAVCEVCAVSFDDVVAAAGRLPKRPQVISLDPSTLDDVLADIPRLADAAGAGDAGHTLATDAERRITAVGSAVAGSTRPRVAAIEWLDPLFLGGHWVPQMIELAGGTDVLGVAGEKSRTASWEELAAAGPEVVVSMPCGYDTARSRTETLRARERLSELGARVVAVDASSYFSRPGPRLVDGIELLGHLLHPELVPPPPGDRWVELGADSVAAS
jgi:iron complex transport system substrate-binding protein